MSTDTPEMSVEDALISYAIINADTARPRKRVYLRTKDLRWANWYWSRKRLPLGGPTKEFDKALRMISWRRF